MYLLGKAGGFPAQDALWAMWKTGRLLIHDLSADEISRCADLMRQYSNVPMDLADASLMATTESMSLKTIFTIDGDFRIYRLKTGAVLEIIP
jgi:uncharacterized protein